MSGQELQANLSTCVLEPIGMEHSFVADGQVDESTATGHTPCFGTERPLATADHERRGPGHPRPGAAPVRLPELPWNSTLITGDPLAYVRDLRAGSGGAISVEGGVATTRSLFTAGLIDALTLTLDHDCDATHASTGPLAQRPSAPGRLRPRHEAPARPVTPGPPHTSGR